MARGIFLLMCLHRELLASQIDHPNYQCIHVSIHPAIDRFIVLVAYDWSAFSRFSSCLTRLSFWSQTAYTLYLPFISINWKETNLPWVLKVSRCSVFVCRNNMRSIFWGGILLVRLLAGFVIGLWRRFVSHWIPCISQCTRYMALVLSVPRNSSIIERLAIQEGGEGNLSRRGVFSIRTYFTMLLQIMAANLYASLLFLRTKPVLESNT